MTRINCFGGKFVNIILYILCKRNYLEVLVLLSLCLRVKSRSSGVDSESFENWNEFQSGYMEMVQGRDRDMRLPPSMP